MVHELVLKAELVEMKAPVGWMVAPELRVDGEALGRMDVDVELGGGLVMVTLLQDLQHMR